MEEKKKRTEHSEYIYPCPVCGNNRQFTWGIPISNGQVRFKPDENLFNSEGLKMRKCNQCGNILMFSKKNG